MEKLRYIRKRITQRIPLVIPINAKGSILIFALWSLFLLTTFSVNLGYGVRQELTLVKRLQERSKLSLIAESGINRAITEIRKEEPKPFSSLNDSWSNNIAGFKEIRLGDGIFSVAYKYTDSESGLPHVQYGLIDEERKVNINKARPEVLRRLFKAVLNYDDMKAQELAASIIDWRDADSELSIPFGSAEDSDYQTLQYPYEAKDADYEVIEEVLLVKGMNSGIFNKIKDYITIYGDGQININTASRPVLLALGLGKEVADKIIAFRSGIDGAEGTGDDNIFDLSPHIIPKLTQSCRLSDAQLVQLRTVVDQDIVTKSNNFMIRSIAILDGRKASSVVLCVIDREGKILYWREQ
ncbi:MAG: hypothetical protein V1893_01065 [Candidatus Omnitrophota bacterium]